MPKTHTDDIAPAFPSSIFGPLQVSDPADATSWIKVDPSNAEIAAAGAARPVRSLMAVYARLFQSGLEQTIGGVILARSINAGTMGGFYLTACRIPEDMDVTAPANVKILMAPGLNATTNGQSTRISLTHTRMEKSGTSETVAVIFDWPIPNGWDVTDINTVLVDNGNGRTYDGNTFSAGDTLGFRLFRSGTAAEDTFDKPLRLGEYIRFEYTAKKL